MLPMLPMLFSFPSPPSNHPDAAKFQGGQAGMGTVGLLGKREDSSISMSNGSKPLSSRPQFECGPLEQFPGERSICASFSVDTPGGKAFITIHLAKRYDIAANGDGDDQVMIIDPDQSCTSSLQTFQLFGGSMSSWNSRSG